MDVWRTGSIVSWALSFGCGGTVASEFCETVCGRAAYCANGSASLCESACITDSTRWLERTDPLLVDATGDCFASSDCRDVRRKERLEECFDQSLSVVEVTEELIRFCEVASARYFECGYRATVSDCLDASLGFSSLALDSAAACKDDDCDEYEICVKRALTGSAT